MPTHSLRQAGREEGKGNMRARSQFAILWSYQMRTEGEGGERGRTGAAISIGPAASNQLGRLPRTDGFGPRRTDATYGQRCARFRYHFPIRLGRAGKVGVVHRKPSKLSRGESDRPTDPLVAVVRPSVRRASSPRRGVWRRRRRLFIGLVGETSDNKSI